MRKLARDPRGGVAPLLAIAAVPLLVSVGAAVDFSRGSDAKTAMQAALDATALAMAKSVTQGMTMPSAQTLFNSLYSRRDVANPTVSSNTSTSGSTTTISLSAQGTMATDFMSVVGLSQLNIGAHSSASTIARVDGCVMALNKTAASAITMSGSTSVNLSNCSVYSNSNSATAVSVGGSANLTADMIGAVGAVSAASSNVTLTEGIQTHLAAITDPYAAVQVPAFSGCTDTNLKVKSDTTINPGVYCLGISINAGATLTLNPGVYTIDRGNLTINGGGSIVGTGVTLIFTSSTGSNYATANINGNASVNLTAPSSGTTAGLVVFVDRNAPAGTAISLEGGSTQSFGGAIYAPSGAVSYSGGAATSTTCTQIIGDTVSFTGNSGVAINCSSYKTKSFGSMSTRLSS